jgi:hypothetical protein
MLLTGENRDIQRKNLSQRHSVYHNLHTECTGFELCLRGKRPATTSLSHGTGHNLLMFRYYNAYILTVVTDEKGDTKC